ncbi:hypothetical protein STRDD11_02672 [Streptococcus sp. DD11]|uniref:hypothetical protein n=1 Tax=Streptococcus sp. DD11 TaxID=1777879 RepID=UPI0007979B34|nr:hypothetical protein [Streptococcus sp. DD11]KXT77367.1 hypothetical protein STRDD11_02672 [Streptococcus sp. DD11]
MFKALLEVADKGGGQTPQNYGKATLTKFEEYELGIAGILGVLRNKRRSGYLTG